MASRLMHLAVAEMLLKSEYISDPMRFRLGCILPDAKIDSALRDAPHFHRQLPNGLVTCGLKSFLELFGERCLSDDLYLGYYMHLIQDMVYRRYMYDLPHWDARIEENVRMLHADYRRLNHYIIETRLPSNNVTAPEGVKGEGINLMFEFDIERFLHELQLDFEIVAEGDFQVFTAAMAEDFFSLAYKACHQELKALREGLPIYDEEKMAWGKE